MDELIYELKFITPCFNGGYSQEKSELRPASFIGLLRFWGRVVLSSFYDGENLYKKESILFGNEEEAGKFYIRIEKKDEIEHKTLANNKYYTLGIGMTGKECIPENYKFKVHIITKSEYTEIIKNICRLAFSWGSLGYKSRKGLGSLKIVKEIINGKESTLETDDMKLLSPEFWRNILKNHKMYENINEIKNNEIPSLRNLIIFKFKDKIKIDRIDKLAFLGKKYKELRKEKYIEKDRTPEYKYIINKFLNGEKITYQDTSKIRNIPFGLPIQYTSRSTSSSRRKQIDLNWKYKNNNDNDNRSNNNRRASMVLFKIKDDTIYALFFKSKLLPDKSCLEVKNKKDEIKHLNLKIDNKKDEVCEFNEDKIIDNLIKALKDNEFEEVRIS